MDTLETDIALETPPASPWSGIADAVDDLLTRVVLLTLLALEKPHEPAQATGPPGPSTSPSTGEVVAALIGSGQAPAQVEPWGLFCEVAPNRVREAVDCVIESGLATLTEGRLRVSSPGLDHLCEPVGRPQPTGVRAALLGSREALDLADRLRAFRAERARECGVRPYRILTDRALRAIAARRPGTLGELARVRGIGPITLAEHGPDIIRCVRTSEAA